MKKKLMIFGAGAIGRGYLPWVFRPDGYEYYFVETNDRLRGLLKEAGRFTTLKTVKNRYEELTVRIEGCFTLEEALPYIDKMDAVVTAVGPRNVTALVEPLRDTKMPIICCENSDSIPGFLASATNNPNVVFAIPDVITSNTAGPKMTKKDPLIIITEDGTCFIDKKVKGLGGNVNYVSKKELWRQWKAKLFIHNTPHCIAAYLGSLINAAYLHEGMADPNVKKIVAGAMHEMRNVLIKKFRIDRSFIDWYANKELKRFLNKLLYDPVSRVAREPFRKLEPNERLLGAAQLCLSCGITCTNIMKGIMAAFCYSSSKDPDSNIQVLLKGLSPRDFLRIAVGLRPGEALYEILIENWDRNLKDLEAIK